MQSHLRFRLLFRFPRIFVLNEWENNVETLGQLERNRNGFFKYASNLQMIRLSNQRRKCLKYFDCSTNSNTV